MEQTFYTIEIDNHKVLFVMPANFEAVRDNYVFAPSGVAWHADAESIFVDGENHTKDFDATIYWFEPYCADGADDIYWDEPSIVDLNGRKFYF